MFTKLSPLLKRSIARFARNRKGVAAVEFAYIAPLLILALFGTVEVSRAVMMHKKFQRVSAMIGDLVSREQTVGTAPGGALQAINGMMLSAEQVMYPFSTDSLVIKVNSLRAKSNDASRTRSEWNYDSKLNTAQSTCTDKAMPATGMINAGNTAIVVESSFGYAPLLKDLIPGFKTTMTWNDTITYSPRKASCVGFDGSNCGELCPGW
ncbi:MAG: TadE/TadG family type IV pilus assembly protein [Hyphomicrobium sp.]